MKQLRNILLTGLVALLPLYLTITLLIWLFQTLDNIAQPWIQKVFGVEIWGLGVAATVLVIFATGLVVGSVTGALFLGWMDRLLERLPIFKGLYRGIKQIVESFNPNNPAGFKEFVLIEQLDGGGFSAGFLTGEFTLTQEDGRRRELATVFIPSNHLYLGAIHIVERSRIVRTAMTLQEGATFALSAGSSAKGEYHQITTSKNPS
ncbi:MAG: DUF502 domain-containing protein [Candidatus Manganitrophaceae bacterium]